MSMAKDIYKNIGERYGLDKHDRKDVKVGAVAVLQGECLTPEQRGQLRMDTYREWRELLSWEKKLLTDALVQWLRDRRCERILEKINAMDEKDRQRFLSEAIRTKKKSFPRASIGTSPGSDPCSPPVTEDGEDSVKDENVKDDYLPSTATSAEERNNRSSTMPIAHVLNPMT